MAKEMARKLEDFSTESDVDDSEAAVERRQNEKKVFIYFDFFLFSVSFVVMEMRRNAWKSFRGACRM
jgi:hypothetical protein